MKDYSKYLGNSYGFITDISLTPSKISITTSKNDQNEPNEYDIKLSKYYLERYEKQYQLIINNKDKIIKGETKKYKIYYLIGLLICLIPFISLPIITNKILTSIILVIGISTILTGAKEIYNYKQEFNREMQLYKRILENKDKIETAIANDKNVTKYLDEQTKKCLEENQRLHNVGAVDDVININFIDKSSLEGLSKLLKMTKISNALQDELIVLNQPSKNNYKKRTRKPNNH